MTYITRFSVFCLIYTSAQYKSPNYVLANGTRHVNARWRLQGGVPRTLEYSCALNETVQINAKRLLLC